jgi:D-arabinose 1-dehydrogenase-like Zn-dependent alcohol dehydrogenase
MPSVEDRASLSRMLRAFRNDTATQSTVQIRQFGDTDGLEVVDAPLPKAGQGEVRVRVLASGLEYTDTLIRRHLYPQTAARRPPFVMGYDLVGEIDQLGNGVSGFQIGDRVADMTVVGSNAAYCTLKARDLTRVPAGVDAAEAAALILSWTTAFQLLHRAAQVRRGQRVLVHGAAGAVGQALIVLGKMAGLELWGAARGRHAALISALGQKRTSRPFHRMSALPPKADIAQHGGNVRFVPKADIERSIRTLCRHGRTNPAGPASRKALDRLRDRLVRIGPFSRRSRSTPSWPSAFSIERGWRGRWTTSLPKWRQGHSVEPSLPELRITTAHNAE